MSSDEYNECNPVSGWDLHCHTVFSDGTKTPAELVDLAYANGLHGVAITDHDTTAGWNDAVKVSRTRHFPLLRGSEVTAQDGHVSVHMLAYQYDPENEGIVDLFRSTREARIDRARRMVSRLSKDFPITWDDVMSQTKKGGETTVGRPHMADALVAAGFYRTRSEAFAGAISSSSKYYIPTPSPSALQVVQVVRQAGGVSVVAHPGDYSRNRILLSNEQIGALADAGLGGLEVWHRGNGTEERERLLGLARELGLLVTGGSDWHGDGKPNRLGENLTADDVVAQIVERGAILLVS
ncbi:PHP domain-containing protein [Bifidobacterium sp. ESL0784]|uniref:PHP domain-containing protein n=1 Tax=Bifidobacterium sp. ESL0784 TaxID=2983231 RepID=UPI0023F6CD1B|nr:PHP domain-containing protein [Bifidobacterium sp. ESL0784]MDF7641677.1 PHP domain-containing protein [Bifidobacterium sp. ESL0784]